MAAAWPDETWLGWHKYTGKNGDKFGSIHHGLFPKAILVALESLAAAVEPLIANSFIDYDFHGAGMHMIPPGGFLARHLDAEFHPLRPWKRTHSIVLFVDDWSPHWGGQLNLEGNSVVTPCRNTAVVFETQDMWHEVLPTTTDSISRRTLALFAWEQVSSNQINDKRSANFSV